MNPEVDNVQETAISRRNLLLGALRATALGAAGTLLVEAASASPRQEPVSSRVRWGLFVDASRCADGCTACVEACERENGMDRLPEPEAGEKLWDRQKPKWIHKVTVKDKLSKRVVNLPLMCQHCESPPCVDVCPTGASFRRADGIVMVDRHDCIGCRYCMIACPYKARSFIHEDVHNQNRRTPRGKGCVESCNLCVHRLDQGNYSTACSEACLKDGHQAILFGDMNDPNSSISQKLKALPSRQLRADLKLNTGVRYSGL